MIRSNYPQFPGKWPPIQTAFVLYYVTLYSFSVFDMGH